MFLDLPTYSSCKAHAVAAACSHQNAWLYMTCSKPHLSTTLLGICVEDRKATVLEVQHVIVFKHHHPAQQVLSAQQTCTCCEPDCPILLHFSCRIIPMHFQMACWLDELHSWPVHSSSSPCASTMLQQGAYDLVCSTTAEASLAR